MKLILFLFFATVFIYCNSNDNRNPQLSSSTYNDTIVKDIPEWYRTSNFTKRWYKAKQKLLKLENLEKGFDSLQIRIWMECENLTGSLIVLEKATHQWNAIFYSFKVDYNEEYDPSIRDLKTENKKPRSGWEIFSKNLIKSGVMDLPDHSKFSPKYNIPNDASWTLVEIGMLNKYRLYTYPELGLNAKILEGPGKLHQTLKLIEQEFDFKRPCQDSTGWD